MSATRDIVLAVERGLTERGPKIQALLGDADPTRAMRIIEQARILVGTTETLQRCTPSSIVGVVLQIASLGLDLDRSAQQVYIIPFKGVATLMVGYRGYITLAHRSGVSMSAQLVRAGDEIRVWGDDAGEHIQHEAEMGAKRTAIIGAYAAARKPGSPTLVEWMPMEDINAIAAKAAKMKAGAFSPWDDATTRPEMQRKTPIRRLAKRLPYPELVRAATWDVDSKYERAAPKVSPAAALESRLMGKEPEPIDTTAEVIDDIRHEQAEAQSGEEFLASLAQ